MTSTLAQTSNLSHAETSMALNLHDETDRHLLKLMNNACPGAFEELFARYETRLIAYASRYVDSIDLAKDVCQEVFLKLINKPPCMLISDSLGPWLFRVARNRAIDKRRSRKFEVSEPTSVFNEPREDETPLRTLSRESDASFIRDLLEELPADLRDVVNMRIYADLSFKEISATLEIPQGTALWRMHRALELLRQRWKSQHDTTM